MAAAYRLMATANVTRTLDNALIPADPTNLDWQEYQKWLAAGNTPDPFVPDPVVVAEQQRRVALKGDSRRQAMLARLATATPAQIDQWLAQNVTNLSQARDVLGDIIKMMALNLTD